MILLFKLETTIKIKLEQCKTEKGRVIEEKPTILCKYESSRQVYPKDTVWKLGTFGNNFEKKAHTLIRLHGKMLVFFLSLTFVLLLANLCKQTEK